MKYYHETLEFFRKHSDFDIDPFPLIWTKSDKRGIPSDPKRETRRIYEACFYGSRGDHKILTPVGNSYDCPTDRSQHPSAKPYDMLREFFRMFVDEHTRMLDPTCGSGTALRGAESLGAEHILGIEINEDHAKLAASALEEARRMNRDKDAGRVRS